MTNLVSLKELIRNCTKPLTAADRHSILDLIDELTDTPVEVWHGERKVSVYQDIVLRVWGPSLLTEMSEEPRTLRSVQDAMDWLYKE